MRERVTSCASRWLLVKALSQSVLQLTVVVPSVEWLVTCATSVLPGLVWPSSSRCQVKLLSWPQKPVGKVAPPRCSSPCTGCKLSQDKSGQHKANRGCSQFPKLMKKSKGLVSENTKTKSLASRINKNRRKEKRTQLEMENWEAATNTEEIKKS